MTITQEAIRRPYSEWSQEALCLGIDNPDIFFTNAFYEDALRFCALCPIRDECLAEGIKQDGIHKKGGLHGIWGGLTPEERAKLRKASKL